MKNVHNSVKDDVISWENWVKFNIQFDLSFMCFLPHSVISLTSCFSSPSYFQYFSFSVPGQIETLFSREEEGGPHTNSYFLSTSEVWKKNIVHMIKLSISYFPSFTKMLYNYDNINPSPPDVVAQGTKVMIVDLKLIWEPIKVYLCKLSV